MSLFDESDRAKKYRSDLLEFMGEERGLLLMERIERLEHHRPGLMKLVNQSFRCQLARVDDRGEHPARWPGDRDDGRR